MRFFFDMKNIYTHDESRYYIFNYVAIYRLYDQELISGSCKFYLFAGTCTPPVASIHPPIHYVNIQYAKFLLWLHKHYAMKMFGGVEVQLLAFSLTSVIDKG
jgi:hypothetical protein